MPQGWRLDLPRELPPADQWRALVEVATKIEKLGFDGAWVYDHLHTFPIREPRTVFEPWTTLNALATLTKTVRLGQLVTCYAYRIPGILAKLSSCLDVISGGRLEFGIGAGWYEEEFNAFGIPYEKASVRIAQLAEAIQIVKRMWTEEETTFRGKYYNVERALNYPKPIQKPHPPVTLGGGGERLTLRLVAEHADKWNVDTPYTVDDCRRKLKILETYCKEIGRQFDQMEISVHRDVIVDRERGNVDRMLKERHRTLYSWLAYQSFLDRHLRGTPSECIEQMRKFVDVGVSHFVMFVPNSLEIAPLELIAEEVVPGVVRK